MTVKQKKGKNSKWAKLHHHYGDRCVYCNAPATTADHVVPSSRGGSSDIENLRPCCEPCNGEKSDLTPLEWLDTRCPAHLRWFTASPEFPPRETALLNARRSRYVGRFKERKKTHSGK